MFITIYTNKIEEYHAGGEQYYTIITISITYYFKKSLLVSHTTGSSYRSPTPAEPIRTWHRIPLSERESDQITSVSDVTIV